MNYNSKNFHAFAGTDSGILKGIRFTRSEAVVKNFPVSTTLDRQNAITALIWRNESEKEIFVGHRDSSVSLFDTATQSYIFRHKAQRGSGKVVSIIVKKEKVFIGLENGRWSSLFKEEKGGPIFELHTAQQTKKYSLKDKRNLTVGKEHPANPTQIATGGCENDLKIWDLEDTLRPVFSAKNVANDNLDLRVPVWVTDLTFMQDNHSIATVSRHHCVRLYDPRVKAKPLLNINYEESPISTVCAVPDRQGQLVLGTAHGRVTMFDLRWCKVKNRAPVVYKGINGGVKQVVAPFPSPPLAFSVSLDRFIRVHNLDTKETLHKEYIKSRPTRLVVRSSLS